MTTQAAAGGFISTCPNCPWRSPWTGNKGIAVEQLAAHQCGGHTEPAYRASLRTEWRR